MISEKSNNSFSILVRVGIEMSFSEEAIQKVWKKGKTVPKYDEDKWRKDQCGAWISRKKHGDRSSEYGWEIDHIDSEGGDELSNLRPLQWKNNVRTSDGRLKCPVTAKGNGNVEEEE